MDNVVNCWLRSCVALTPVLFLIGGCSESASSASSTPPLAETKTLDAAPRSIGEQITTTGQPEQVAAVTGFEVERVEAETLGLVSGKFICVDEFSLKPVCEEVGDTIYANEGSLFLNVRTYAKNTGTIPGTFEVEGLVASYNGKQYKYAPDHRVERDSTVEIQPLSVGNISGYYEIPIEVLDNATIFLSLGDEKGIELEFQTPREKAKKKAAAVAQDKEESQQQSLADRAEEGSYEKCWSLNDKNASVVTEEEFAWYVQECSNMYDVGTYGDYLQRRHGG